MAINKSLVLVTFVWQGWQADFTGQEFGEADIQNYCNNCILASETYTAEGVTSFLLCKSRPIWNGTKLKKKNMKKNKFVSLFASFISWVFFCLFIFVLLFV